MTAITVGNSAGFLQAVKAAKPGDVIQLAPGTYSNLSIKNFDAGSGVTITSQDASNPAVLTDLMVSKSQGLNFSNLEFSTAGSTDPYPFRVTGSENINFTKLNVHGSLNNDPSDDVSGPLIRDSNNVSITNSEFYELGFGINHLESTNLTFSGNKFYDLRSDGVHGGGSSYVTITNNTFTDFKPNGSDHPDAIQFFTTGVPSAGSDIVISGNVITRGDGGIIQGIFLRNAAGTMAFKNVQIENNIVSGGMYNGIAVITGENVTIKNNLVESLPDMKSWIRVDNATNVVVQNNDAIDFVYDGVKNLTQAGNDKIAAVSKSTTSLPLNQPSVVVETPTQITPPTQPAQPSQPVVQQPPVAQGPAVQAPPEVDPPSPPASEAPQVLPNANPTGSTVTTGETYLFKLSDFNLTLTGAKDADVIGNTSNNVIFGNSAKNQITGMGGDDYIRGGDGNDLLRGDGGNDILGGDAGNDTLVGGAGSDSIWGGDGKDNITGDDGNDMLYGDLGDDKINGGIGADTIYGGVGADQLLGGKDSDLIFGGDGNDYISGDLGNDILYGGAGADTFNMAKGFGVDQVMDFSFAQGDKVKLAASQSYTVSQVGADTVVNLGGGDQMVLVGVDMSTLKAGWLMTT